MGFEIYQMIEMAKSHGLIAHDDDAFGRWEEGKELYVEFTKSEFNVDNELESMSIEKFLIKKELDTDAKTPEDELSLNIRALNASFDGNGDLANTLWSLIELKGYERLDLTMSLEEMYAKI